MSFESVQSTSSQEPKELQALTESSVASPAAESSITVSPERLQQLLQLEKNMMKRQRNAGLTEDDQDSSAESASKKQREDGEEMTLTENPFLNATFGYENLTQQMTKMRAMVAEAIQKNFPNHKWAILIINMPGIGLKNHREPPVSVFNTDAKNAQPLAVAWGSQIAPQIASNVIKRWGSQKPVRDALDARFVKGSGDALEGIGWSYTKTFAALNKGEGVTNVVIHSTDNDNTDCHVHVLYGYEGAAFNGTQMAKSLTANQLKPWTIIKRKCQDPALALMNHMEPRETGVWMGSNSMPLSRLAKMVYDTCKLYKVVDVPEQATIHEEIIEDEIDSAAAGFLAPMGSSGSHFNSYQVDNLCSSKTAKFKAKLDYIENVINRNKLETYSMACWLDMLDGLEETEQTYFRHMTLYQESLVRMALSNLGRKRAKRKPSEVACDSCSYKVEDVATVLDIVNCDRSHSTWEGVYFKVINVIENKFQTKKNTLWIYGPSNFGKSSVFVRGLSWIGPIARFPLTKVGDFQFGNLTHPHSLSVCDDPSGVVIEAQWPILKAIFAGQSTDANEKYERQAKTFPAPVMICSNSPTIDLYPDKVLDRAAFNNRMLHIDLGKDPCLPDCCTDDAQELLWKWAFYCFKACYYSANIDRSFTEFDHSLHDINAFMSFISRLNPNLPSQVSSFSTAKANCFLTPINTSEHSTLERSTSTTSNQEDNNSI